MRRLCIALVLGLSAGLSLGPASLAANPSLYANYVPNCTFTFVNDSGAAVSSVAPGAYQIVVFTPFAFGNGNAACEAVKFHITGPGVDFETDLGGGDEETEQHTITLQAGGTYTVQDDARPAQTRRTFTVAASGTAAPASGPSSSSSTSTPSSSSSSSKAGTPSKDLVGSAVGTLDAVVSRNGKVTLEHGKKGVSFLKSGRYTIRIVDRSNAAGFAVQTVKHTPKTLSTVPFTGSRSVTVTLAAGQWYFLSPGGTRHAFIVTR